MTDTRTLILEREMPFAPEKIWRALTEGTLIKEWLMDNDFQPIVGHKFNLRARPVPNWNGVIDGDVRIVKPNKKLSYSWIAMGLESVVVWTLTRTATGTLLRLEHSGFRADQEHAFKGANYGWQKFLGQLEHAVAHLQGEEPQ